jgi:hypothetical protein
MRTKEYSRSMPGGRRFLMFKPFIGNSSAGQDFGSVRHNIAGLPTQWVISLQRFTNNKNFMQGIDPSGVLDRLDTANGAMLSCEDDQQQTD